MSNLSETASCILCGKADFVQKVARVQAYDILYCTTCELRFSNPMSHPGGAFYEASHLYANRASGNVSLNLPALDWRCRTLFGNFPAENNGRMLDIGSGDGGLMSHAQKLGMDAFGIEIDPRGVQIAKEIRGLKNVVAGDLKTLESLGWPSFDRVTCFEVMEHLPDPKELLRLIYRMLKPGGLAAITVPRWDRNPALFDPETDYPPHHFTLWTPKAMEKVFAQAGFGPATVYKAPLMIQNFVYLWVGQRKAAKALKAMKTVKASSGLEANSGSASRPVSSPSQGEGEILPLRVNRRRVAIKAATYTICNALDPLLRIVYPTGRGSTLLAVARKPL
jgi:2-polyprenyl-3-methyl-5-hydroxy-6-metoxy-1,4-benzoquinol methylase